MSKLAREFLEMAAPQGLDRDGWHALAHAPVLGWPSDEIIAAMYRTPALKLLPPIDIVGMATDLNPGGLYLRGKK